MSQPPTEPIETVSMQRVAGLFARLGWIGFWLQVALATLPIVMLVYMLWNSAAHPSAGRRFDMREYVAFGSLLVLLFTMAWSYRYTRLAGRMRTPEKRPASAAVLRTLWVGILAGCAGAFISVVLLMGAVGRLLFVFMNAPQGGFQVVQTTTDTRAGWISTIDMLDLMTMAFTLAAEWAVLALSLWLLFRMLQWAPAYDRAAGGE